MKVRLSMTYRSNSLLADKIETVHIFTAQKNVYYILLVQLSDGSALKNKWAVYFIETQ
jgi:hypothetical protein